MRISSSEANCWRLVFAASLRRAVCGSWQRMHPNVPGRRRACTLCRYSPLAQVYDQAGARDSAIAYYAGYVNAFDSHRAFWDASRLGPALERLAVLYDEAGDLENAALYYARFVELWKNADPELQPRVEAAQQRLNEIFAARG